jgi:hypothetical protein
MNLRAADLRPGDMLDLEPVTYAGNDPAFEFEYIECVGVELETPDCVRVDHDGGAFGCPPDTLIEVKSRS